MIKDKILVKFGNKLQQERKKRGLSQEEFAEMVGVHRTYIGMVERAEKNITLLNIEKICRALNISISTMFQDVDNKWDEQIIKISQKYNLCLDSIPDIIEDLKVLPMIRGKSFEFYIFSKLQQILDTRVWKTEKLILNPQSGNPDEDITITYLENHQKITVECKLSAKGKYKVIEKEGKNYFQIQVKCMRSRTLGDSKIKELAPKLNVDSEVLKIHNDQYLSSDFDLVITSLANSFYETIKTTKTYEWQPKNEAIDFLKILSLNQTLNLDDPDIQKNFAFQQLYIARSQDLVITTNNSISCTRKKCKNKTDCGFIPNYPVMIFDLKNGKVLPPWRELKDCLPLLESFLSKL